MLHYNKETVNKVLITSALLFINALFCVKYFERYTTLYPLVTAFLLSLQVGVLYFSFYGKCTLKQQKIIMYLLLILAVIGSLFVFRKIHISSLNVDRWSVIYSFWEAFFNGDYPYFAKSHMNNPPGPMPIYFVIALPFYLINEIGWMPLVAVLIGVLFVNKQIKNPNSQLVFILFMFTFMGFYWELLSRSTILLNSFLVLIVLLYSEKSIARQNYSFYLSALLTGVILSTRMVFVMPFLSLGIMTLLSKKVPFSRLFSWTALALFAFALTFLPFYIGFQESFFVMNPFKVQSGFLLPSIYNYLFILISIVLSLFFYNQLSLLLLSGYSLFISIFIYFVYHLMHSGLQGAYFQSGADISYFLFCVPFLLLHFLIEKKVNN
jgi:hypothetical protein